MKRKEEREKNNQKFLSKYLLDEKGIAYREMYMCRVILDSWNDVNTGDQEIPLLDYLSNKFKIIEEKHPGFFNEIRGKQYNLNKSKVQMAVTHEVLQAALKLTNFWQKKIEEKRREAAARVSGTSS